mmetsp:Transcript_2524/g.8088  ORF Transcript_2524/g.8088 Transcript_2524/m.8088 type:complete len:233 (-) Transcript_2524:345-1043(-)
MPARDPQRLERVLPLPSQTGEQTLQGVHERRREDIVHGRARDEHREVARRGGHVERQVVHALDEPFESSLNLQARDVVRVQRAEKHRGGFFLLRAAVHGHRHQTLDEVVLIQRLLGVVQQRRRRGDVARVEVLLHDGRRRRLVRDDDVRPRERAWYRLQYRVVRLFAAVVVGVVRVQREDRVRLVDGGGFDGAVSLLLLRFFHPRPGFMRVRVVPVPRVRRKRARDRLFAAV